MRKKGCDNERGRERTARLEKILLSDLTLTMCGGAVAIRASKTRNEIPSVLHNNDVVVI